MSGGVGTEKIFFTECLKQGLYIKAPFTQYVGQGWRQKVQFKENARRDWYRKSIFNPIC